MIGQLLHRLARPRQGRRNAPPPDTDQQDGAIVARARRRHGAKRRPTLIRVGGLVAALLAAGLAVPHTASARAEATPASPVGTWNYVDHLPTGDYPVGLTLHADGTMAVTSHIVRLPCFDNDTVTCSVGETALGIWRWRSARQNTLEFTLTEVIFRDADGSIAGYVIPHARVTLSEDGSSFHTTSVTGIFNALHELAFMAETTGDATRMTYPSYGPPFP